MAELSGETIKNAIARELNEIFPEIVVYKEEQSTPYDFPNFFILQLSANTTEDRKDHYFQTYLYNIRYRHVADVETEPRIEQSLDRIGLDLITNFTTITINNIPYKIRQANYEKVDKVVHFTFQVRVQVEKEKTAGMPMRKLEQNTNIKGSV